MMLPMGESKRDETGPGTMFIAVSTVAGLMVTIVLSWVAWRALDRPIEELPGWIEAGATVAAVGAAIIAGFYAARAYGLEHQREQRWEDAERSAQASKVVAWPLGPSTVIQDSYVFISGLGAVVRNSSDLPVSDVTLTFYMVLDDGSAHDGVKICDWTMAFLPPETTQPVNVSLDQEARRRTALPRNATPRILLEMTFRDVATTAWRRDVRGKLEMTSLAT
jgi:hypothetical protein